MKFEPLVQTKENKLFLLKDNSELNIADLHRVSFGDVVSNNAQVCAGKVTCVSLSFGDVQLENETYNEEGLALLREYLKKIEDAGGLAFIEVFANQKLDDADKADSFISAMVHAARRIKDAESVIGFSIAPELLVNDSKKPLDANSWSMWFVNEMNVKHAHYVYLVRSDYISQCNIDIKSANIPLVLY